MLGLAFFARSKSRCLISGKRAGMDSDSVFYCVPLKCRLTRKRCGERFVRAESLQNDGSGGWLPKRWGSFASPCRQCKIGGLHAGILGIPKPDLPVLVVRQDEANNQNSRERDCVACGATFFRANNRQKWCPTCSPSNRFKLLRKSNKSVCFSCGSEYVRENDRIGNKCPACTA
jgi:hypothetical protein